MELDTSDVGSEIQELEEPELEEPELEEPELEEPELEEQELEEQELEEPELEELYESAEPPRERNRGIDDSMIHAHSELLRAYLRIPSRISKRNAEIDTCKRLLEGYKAENIRRQNEADIEKQMQRFENNEK